MPETTERRDFLKVATALGVAGAVGTAAAGEAPAMRIVGICCSPRKGKTTAAALTAALEAARQVNPDRIVTELIELAGLNIPVFDPAAQDPGDFAGLVPRLSDPEVRGIIVGTPVYFCGMTGLCKTFLDHCVAFRRDGFALANKVAGALAVGGVRNGGQELAVSAIQASLLCQEMIIVGDGRPTGHLGGTLVNSDDSIAGDDFGLKTARNLGRRVAEIAIRLG